MTGSGVVVVGIDGSTVSNAAAVIAADEARLRHGLLLVAHAIPLTNHSAPDARAVGFGEAMCREVAASIAASHPNLACETVVREAHAAELLSELSAAADLLVVGTHRMGRLRGWVLGSVSQQVAADAACPVITTSGVPEHGRGAIVLGASASEGGVAALRFACREARLRQVPVRAVRSITTEDWMLSAAGYPLVIGRDVLRDAAQAEIHKLLAVAQESYPDIPITGEVTGLNPYSAILEAAGDASLIVVGARRRSDAALPRLGPVTAWLLHHAQCPLAVVGHNAHDSAAAAVIE